MSSSTPTRLTPADAERYTRLRLRMLHESPWAFSASPDDDRALDRSHLARIFDSRDHATFAVEAPTEASEDPELVAVASITRGTPPKFGHRARIWGVFVEPAVRGKGFGKAVLMAAIDFARTWPEVEYLDLGVSQNSPEALALYQSLGFRAWGREPEATQVGGRWFDEIHMTLRLPRDESKSSAATRAVEIRSYNLKPGTRPEFHRLMSELGIPMLERWNVDVVAHGPSPHDEDSYYLIRSYADLPERQRSQDAFYGSDEWRQGPRAPILALIDSYTTIVLHLDPAIVDCLRDRKP